MKTFTRKQLFVRTTTCFAVVIIACLYMTGCASTPYSKADKALFGTVATLQIVDGLTTVDLLSGGMPICDTWAWKYGTNRPSASKMWLVKSAELGGAYVIGRYLPQAWRKGFFLAVDALLFSCIMDNMRFGAGFSITY